MALLSELRRWQSLRALGLPEDPVDEVGRYEVQDEVMRTPPPDIFRIILSTNIAESSITIPYIEYGNAGHHFLLQIQSYSSFLSMTSKTFSVLSYGLRAYEASHR